MPSLPEKWQLNLSDCRAHEYKIRHLPLNCLRVEVCVCISLLWVSESHPVVSNVCARPKIQSKIEGIVHETVRFLQGETCGCENSWASSIQFNIVPPDGSVNTMAGSRMSRQPSCRALSRRVQAFRVINLPRALKGHCVQHAWCGWVGERVTMSCCSTIDFSVWGLRHNWVSRIKHNTAQAGTSTPIKLTLVSLCKDVTDETRSAEVCEYFGRLSYSGHVASNKYTSPQWITLSLHYTDQYTTQAKCSSWMTRQMVYVCATVIQRVQFWIWTWPSQHRHLSFCVSKNFTSIWGSTLAVLKNAESGTFFHCNLIAYVWFMWMDTSPLVPLISTSDWPKNN